MRRGSGARFGKNRVGGPALARRTFCGAAFASALAPTAWAAGETKQLSFGTTQQESSGYAYCVAVSRLVKQANPDINMTVISTGGVGENLRRTQANHPYDLWIGSVPGIKQSMLGLMPAIKPSDQWRLLWIVNVDGLFVSVRADSGVTRIQDLPGKNFYDGAVGSSAQLAADGLISALNVAPNVQKGGLDDAITAVEDGRAVGFVKSSSLTNPDASLIKLSATTRLRVLGLADADVAAVKVKFPYWSFGTVPVGVYGNDTPIRVVSQPWGIWGDPKMSEDTAYRIVKAVMEDVAPQKAAFPALTNDLARQTLEVAEENSMTMHAGLYRYLSEKGMKPANAVKPPEAGA